MDKKEVKEYIIKLSIAVALILIISILVLCIIYSKTILNLIKTIVNIILPFIYGGCIAYLLTPLCNKIKNRLDRKNRKHSHYLSIIITETIFVVVLIVTCIIIVPQSIKSIGNIVVELPRAIDVTQNWIDIQLKNHVWVRDYVGNSLDSIENTFKEFVKNEILPNFEFILTNIFNSATIAGKLIINLIMGVLISIFALANRMKFAKQTKRIIYAVFGKRVSKLILDELHVANKMFSGFFFGKTVDSLIIGIMCFIALAIMDMPYKLLVSVIVGITNIIPIVGPFIGAIPGIIIIFSSSPIKAIYFLIFIIALQQLDGHVIGPKCIGSATGLSTFWVLFSIIFFGGLWGIIGMIVGVPLMAIIFDIIDKLINKLLRKRGLNEDSIE